MRGCLPIAMGTLAPKLTALACAAVPWPRWSLRGCSPCLGLLGVSLFTLQSPLRSADVLSVTALSASQRVTRGRGKGSALMRGRWTTRADPPTEGGQNQRESESGEA